MDSPQRSFTEQLARDANQFASVAPRLQRGLGNVVAGVVDQLCTSPLDFVYQLLQNADDKEYEADVVPEMGFAIKPTRQGGFVHAWDNGLALSNEQVEALVTFRSTKRDDRATIGEKGIGWHSVFRITERPHVYSGGFSFRLGGEGAGSTLEAMLTPKWVEEQDLPFLPKPGTNFFLPLRDLDDATLKDLDSLHQRFSPLMLLFLRKLRRVTIEPQRFAVELEGDVWTVRARSAKQKIEQVVQRVVVVRPKMPPVPPELQARDPQIVLAFPISPSGPQSLFAWLPVTATGLKFLVHADFVTTLSREALLADAWNAWLWRQMPSALANAVQELVVSPDAPLYSTWLDLWPTSELRNSDIQTAVEEAERLLRELPVVATTQGLREPSLCVMAAEDERAILTDADLALIGRYYPLPHIPRTALARFGTEAFGPDLLRRYVTEKPGALLARLVEDDRLLDRIIMYMQRNDIRDVACLPVSTPDGPALQTPGSQLLGASKEEVAQLMDMGVPVVLVLVGRKALAWLEGMGLRRATPDFVLDAILALPEGASDDAGDLRQSVLQLRYLHSVWDELTPAFRARLSSELQVWTESLTGQEARLCIQATHIRDPALFHLFRSEVASKGGPVSPPPSVRFLAEAYGEALEDAGLLRLGAWASPRLAERWTEVEFSMRGHPLLEQWSEEEKLPTTATNYTFRHWEFPDDVLKFVASQGAERVAAFLEMVASHWDSYEPCRRLRLQHTWWSKRPCPHRRTSCEECITVRSQRWDAPPFLQTLKAMRVPTSSGPDPRQWRRLDETILLPARERARLGGIQLPLPALAAEIGNPAFLRACGVATEVTPDILLRGLQQLRERPPSDELLRQVQAFYSLLEHVSSDEAFQLTDNWPLLACDPCPRELERRALERSHGDVQERREALHQKIQKSLRWFSLSEVRWDGPARVVAGNMALLSQQRTPDARRVYTERLADILRVPDVGAHDLVDVLDNLAKRPPPLNDEESEKVVLIYEELAHISRGHSLDEALLARIRRRLLTHRREFVSGLVFACDDPRELGLARRPDIHFLHFPQAVTSHQRFLAQLGVPLAKDNLRETYVGPGGSIDRSSTDILRSRLDWLARVAVRVLAKAKALPPSDWACFGELARVEVVPEVTVEVELGLARAQARVPHAVDWSPPQRCAVILGHENKRARTARGQRVLAAGVADLLATLCGTASTTELLRLVGLVLATPLNELPELAEDERLAALPPAVRAALGQREVSAPAALLAPLRDDDGSDGGGREAAHDDGEAPSSSPAPSMGGASPAAVAAPNGATPLPPQPPQPPGAPPAPEAPGASPPLGIAAAARERAGAAAGAQSRAEEGGLDDEEDEEEVLAQCAFLAEDDASLAAGGRSGLEALSAVGGGDGAPTAALQAEEAEAARLRVEAALAREDAEAAQRALQESPVPLSQELTRKVNRLVRHHKIVVTLRKAVRMATTKGAEWLRRTVRAAEKTGSRSPAINEALQEARKCLQDMAREARRETALQGLRACGALDAGVGARVVAEIEAALTEAWEAGVDGEDPDFVVASSQLAVAHALQARGALVAALAAGEPGAVAAAASELQLKLSLAESELSATELEKGRALLARAEQEQAVTRRLSTALAAGAAPDEVAAALDAARGSALAAPWAEHAQRWLDRGAEVERRRLLALGRLEAAAAGGANAEDFAAALRDAREFCSAAELEPFERQCEQRVAQAQQARMALMGAHHVELLSDALALLPPGLLPDAEVEQWRATCNDWLAKVATALAEFDFASHGGDVEGMEAAYHKAVTSGAGPQVLESMQQALQGAREAQAAAEASERHRAAQIDWWREQQAGMWRRFLEEERDISAESLQAAAAFAREAQDKPLLFAAEALLVRLDKAEGFWRVAESTDSAADWRVAAVACRSSQQMRRGQDAEVRAALAAEREAAARDLARAPLDGGAAAEAELLPALQRAQELGLPEHSLAPARAHLARSAGTGAGGRGGGAGVPRPPFLRGGDRDVDGGRHPGDPQRETSRVLPGEYGVDVLGRTERVSPYGAEALAELGLIAEDAKLRWGAAELPLGAVVRPQGYSTVEGDVLGKELRRAERKLNEIGTLEERILKKEKLSKEEWHKVAHKTLLLQEHRLLQAKLAASGAERINFSEVWEAVCMVRDRAGCDPFERHLLEGAPAEPAAGGCAPLAAGAGPRCGAPEVGAGKRVGALGELYVFSWLQKLIDGFSFENWCSSCRSAHPDAPAPEPDIDRHGCDFWFHDTVGIFCRDREVLLEVKTKRVVGDPDAARAIDFSCRVSAHELAVMREVGESERAYYVMLWVVVGDNLACRVVAVLRQPHALFPTQLSLQPTEYLATLSSKFGPPGLTLEEEGPRGGYCEI